MITIKFSHKYKKMPPGYERSLLTGISVVDIQSLNPDFIEADTAIVGGGNYPLPLHGRGIIIRLATNGTRWTTIRRWTAEKEALYKDHLGEEVECRIVSA